MVTASPHQFLSLKQAAAYLGIVKSTFREIMRSGEGPPCYRFTYRYQFKKEDLDAWIESQKK